MHLPALMVGLEEIHLPAAHTGSQQDFLHIFIWGYLTPPRSVRELSVRISPRGC